MTPDEKSRIIAGFCAQEKRMRQKRDREALRRAVAAELAEARSEPRPRTYRGLGASGPQFRSSYGRLDA